MRRLSWRSMCRENPCLIASDARRIFRNARRRAFFCSYVTALTKSMHRASFIVTSSRPILSCKAAASFGSLTSMLPAPSKSTAARTRCISAQEATPRRNNSAMGRRTRGVTSTPSASPCKKCCRKSMAAISSRYLPNARKSIRTGAIGICRSFAVH